jgi:excisionase family DNA binding protein
LTAYVLQPAVKESYTVEEAADRTGFACWTIRQACNKRQIAAEKVNEQWRIPHAELVRIQNYGIGRV